MLDFSLGDYIRYVDRLIYSFTSTRNARDRIMSNMSYCRFRNTLADLEDCYEHIDDYDLSDEEKEAKKQLIELCTTIAWEEGDDY